MKVGHEILRMLIDKGIVSDYCDDYGEPGYRKQQEDGIIIIGDVWCHDRNCGYETEEDGRRKLHSVEVHWPRLFKAMDEQGIEFDWSDEWIIDYANNKAYRTQPDSYSWQSSIRWTDDGEFITPDDPIEDWIELCVNNPRTCLPRHIWSDSDLNEQGFTEYQCGYENGWHPGQTDDPEKISELITTEYEEQGKEVDILYKLSHVAQFDIGFCVFVREVKEDAEVGSN